jgi:hypothetical protein
MVQEKSNNALMTVIVGVGAFVLGLIIGLPVLGWLVFPVEWINAGPADLAPSAKADYIQMVADSFAMTGDQAKAQERMQALGAGASQALQDRLAASTGPENLRMAQLVSVVSGSLPPPEGTGNGTGGGITNLQSLILPICAGLLLIAVLVGGGLFLYMRFVGGMPKRKTEPGAPTATQQRGAAPVRVETPPDIAAEAGPEPVTTFKTNYMLGNDLFDESFSIDDQQGDFLGECGVGIGETIGVGDPKKVTAFEVWLFDKNDIRTVTKVIMSEHAFNDEGLKSRLSAKGEPVMARSDAVVEMETATLKVAARIVDMQYGSGALPPNSFFQQLTLEISAWKKAEG